jgi:hypothetical protein
MMHDMLWSRGKDELMLDRATVEGWGSQAFRYGRAARGHPNSGDTVKT